MSKPRLFREKPGAPFEAMQWDGTERGYLSIVLWATKHDVDTVFRFHGDANCIVIKTRRSNMQAIPGDWIAWDPRLGLTLWLPDTRYEEVEQ